MISFIVPAHNEERLLPATLQAIGEAAKSVGEPYEVIVVDDASTDATSDVARKCGAKVVRIERRQIASARNAGARESSGERLFFVDADTLITSDVLGAAMRAMDSGAVGGGATARMDGRLPLYARAMLSASMPLFRMLRLAPGCFVFCTRRAFEASGGFDERYYAAEDIVVSNALKRQGRFVILREHVVTSGRKARANNLFDLSRLLVRLLRYGLKSRKALGFWYEKRTDDTELRG
ncbi:MAG: glycosyl transferase family 2 [Elusimicrobia bacterium HGW-Elusimicrobia-1]|jgi:glycosyltransferase involved in cell wall biosynthesis|nr:MAG: glycosyl transferase family 2 [Elusimicrobia bacterium HGW-Elusimicrobia-1]